jgi:hypothetical protein
MGKELPAFPCFKQLIAKTAVAKCRQADVAKKQQAIDFIGERMQQGGAS